MLTLNCDEVSGDIVVGTYPQTPEDIRHLREELGVTAVLSLQDDDDLEALGVRWDLLQGAYARQGVHAVREPVRDFSPRALVARLPACVARLEELVSAGHRVYLHCTAGVNRSPTVAIAWLHAHHGMSVRDATACVTDARECYPYEDVLKRLEALLGDG